MAEPWQLQGFGEQLDEWIELEQPYDWLRTLVVTWVLGLIDDPYPGLHRERGFDNLWFGVVPGSLNGDEAVCCSLWIDEKARRVRCDPHRHTRLADRLAAHPVGFSSSRRPHGRNPE